MVFIYILTSTGNSKKCSTRCVCEEATCLLSSAVLEYLWGKTGNHSNVNLTKIKITNIGKDTGDQSQLRDQGK